MHTKTNIFMLLSAGCFISTVLNVLFAFQEKDFLTYKNVIILSFLLALLFGIIHIGIDFKLIEDEDEKEKRNNKKE